MPNWTESMQQTFEFYVVDPGTWGDSVLFDKAISATITRALESETRGSATINATEALEECYVRIYLVTIQNGIKERFPLATVLVQTPSTNFDGRLEKITMDAYTPLLELKDTKPPYGFTVMRNANVMETVATLADENARAPVVYTVDDTVLEANFVSNFMSDTWLSFLSDLSANAKFEFGLDEMGRIIFNPIQKISALQPVWTYTDDNSSILNPEIDVDRDLYGVPNVVEVLYSTDSGYKFSRVENNDLSSPISIPTRGREVIHRVSNPSGLINPTQGQLDVYAANLLESLSVLEYTLTYTHGYCPVRVGDCVHLNYKRAKLINVKAMVATQSIECRPGCQVTETAFFTTRLWR